MLSRVVRQNREEQLFLVDSETLGVTLCVWGAVSDLAFAVSQSVKGRVGK